MALITMEQAIGHLRRDFPDPIAESDLQLKMEQATAIVLRYIKSTGATWTEDTTGDPAFTIVQAAILKVLGNLFLFRGDDDEPKGPLTPDVELMLSMFRDPTFS